MSPTPITLFENTLSTSLFSRSAWEASLSDHLDPKAVGGHLPLSKRNSTPVGVGAPYSPLKVALQHTQMITTTITGETPVGVSSHRHLDRCHSEPLKPAAHQVQPSAPGSGTSSSRYKTELCRPFAETGYCKYGEKCQFAHGQGELRNMPRHPKYKTELCRTFHTTGLCGYGTRCHFIHNADERRNTSPMAFNPGVGRGGSEEDLPLHQSLSPPASLHGSPTSSAGTFFGDTFSLVHSHTGGTQGPQVPLEESHFSMLSLETPPVSPVESLAGDMEGLSLSPTLSDSPSPPAPFHGQAATYSTFLDSARYLRLPIFESLKEAL